MNSIADLLNSIDFPLLAQNEVRNILIAMGVLFAYLFIASIISPKIKNNYTRYIWKKINILLVLIFFIVVIGRLWFTWKGVVTFLALIAAGLTIVFKEVLLNLISSIIIVWRNLFVLGDRIQIDEHKGDVIDIGMFYFSLLEIGNWVQADQSTGRVIKVPNSHVLTHPVINYHKGIRNIWNEIPVLLSPQSNWKKLRKLLITIATPLTCEAIKASKKAIRSGTQEVIIYSKLDPIVYLKGGPDGLLLTLRYLCDPKQRRDTEHVIWQSIFEAVAQHDDIKLKYHED